MKIVKAAAVQLSPVLYSREGTIDKVVRKLHDLQRQGVQFAAFPETVMPYYPYFSFVQQNITDLSNEENSTRKLKVCSRRPRKSQLVNQIYQSKKVKNHIVTIIVASALIVFVVIARQKAQAQNTDPQPKMAEHLIADAAGDTANQSFPIFVTEIPSGYRDWRLISVAREEGHLDDIRALLGNDIAIKAYREGTLPFPEGAIIARVAWSYVSSEENNKVFGQAQSFVAGSPKNGVQFMVKDSRKYAQTGGWGYAQFDDGKPSPVAKMQSCFPCHQAVKDRDFIFTRYSP
jgi:hypothetical protein